MFVIFKKFVIVLEECNKCVNITTDLIQSNLSKLLCNKDKRKRFTRNK